MKFLVLTCVLATAFARPSADYYSTVPALPVATSYIEAQPTSYIAPGLLVSQYHSQDALGQYAYGYNGGQSAKNEVRGLDGVTRGSYSYLDAEGKVQSVAYTADASNGFRVAATNLPEAVKALPILPEPVKDTYEVAKAKAEHLAIVQSGRFIGAGSQFQVLPEPVKETAEVAKARAEHMAAIEKVKINPGFSGVAFRPEFGPEPIKDTAEVAIAKAEHFKAVEEAKLRNAIAASNEIKTIATPIAFQAAKIAIPSAADVNFVSQPLLKFAGPAIGTKLELPAAVTKVEKIESAIPAARFAAIDPKLIITLSGASRSAPIAAPFGYAVNVAAPGYSYSINGLPVASTLVDANGRLIRSVKED